MLELFEHRLSLKTKVDRTPTWENHNKCKERTKSQLTTMLSLIDSSVRINQNKNTPSMLTHFIASNTFGKLLCDKVFKIFFCYYIDSVCFLNCQIFII